MILDTIDGFEALKNQGIAVARSRRVDSAEDAVAFAARRTARDARSVTILLRIVRPGNTAAPSVAPLNDDEAIRRAYHQLSLDTERAGGYILAQDVVERGTEVAIEGREDAALGKVIAVRCGGHEVRRMIPLGEAGADVLVSEFRAYHHQPADAKARKMLAHLLLALSRFFEESGVERFELNPVRLHENSYTVLDATLIAPHPLHIEKRLDRHAHDRKSYGYHPAGRQ